MNIKLEVGKPITGLLIDGVEGNPYLAGTLSLQESGVSIQVPFKKGDPGDQFRMQEEWFERRNPPVNAIFLSQEGHVYLFGLRWRSSSQKWHLSMGELTADLGLLGAYHKTSEVPLEVTEFMSEIDGLDTWSRISGIDVEAQKGPNGRTSGFVAVVESAEALSWRQGDARMSIQTHWNSKSSKEGGGLNIDEKVVLVSVFDNPRSVDEHLVEHMKVANLLTMLAGVPMAFRKHQVKDESVCIYMGGGEPLGGIITELISSRTFRQSSKGKLSTFELNQMLCDSSEIGVLGLESWATKFEDWKRFILPAVGLLGRRGAFMEDAVISMSMSLEAAGKIIGIRAGEEDTYYKGKPTTATYVLRCVDRLGVDWSFIAINNVALARAIASNYNGIKHFNNGEFPDTEETYLVSRLAKLIVRLLTLVVMDESENLLRPFVEGSKEWQLKQAVGASKFRIGAGGKLIENAHE